MSFSKREAPNCDWCPYKKNCFFWLLNTKEAQKQWKEMRLARRFKPGETVFYEGEKPRGLYVVCTGRVKIYKTSRGGQQLVTRIESPGDLVGHRSMLSGENYAATAETLGESVVSVVDEATFVDFLVNHPKACLALLRELSKDVRRGEDKARDIAFKPARARLGAVLINTMHANGGAAPALGDPSRRGQGERRTAAPALGDPSRRGQGERRTAAPVVSGLKRKDLAEMAGLTIETTVRLLNDFEKRGLIHKRGKELLIVDEPQLRSIADRYH